MHLSIYNILILIKITTQSLPNCFGSFRYSTLKEDSERKDELEQQLIKNMKAHEDFSNSNTNEYSRFTIRKFNKAKKCICNILLSFARDENFLLDFFNQNNDLIIELVSDYYSDVNDEINSEIIYQTLFKENFPLVNGEDYYEIYSLILLNFFYPAKRIVSILEKPTKQDEIFIMTVLNKRLCKYYLNKIVFDNLDSIPNNMLSFLIIKNGIDDMHFLVNERFNFFLENEDLKSYGIDECNIIRAIRNSTRSNENISDDINDSVKELILNEQNIKKKVLNLLEVLSLCKLDVVIKRLISRITGKTNGITAQYYWLHEYDEYTSKCKNKVKKILFESIINVDSVEKFCSDNKEIIEIILENDYKIRNEISILLAKFIDIRNFIKGYDFIKELNEVSSVNFQHFYKNEIIKFINDLVKYFNEQYQYNIINPPNNLFFISYFPSNEERFNLWLLESIKSRILNLIKTHLIFYKIMKYGMQNFPDHCSMRYAIFSGIWDVEIKEEEILFLIRSFKIVESIDIFFYIKENRNLKEIDHLELHDIICSMISLINDQSNDSSSDDLQGSLIINSTNDHANNSARPELSNKDIRNISEFYNSIFIYFDRLNDPSNLISYQFNCLLNAFKIKKEQEQ